MHWSIGILLFFGTVLFMEGVAYVAHRWVMHGFGWFLHKSHHRPRTGNWELNDFYALIFAIPSFVLLLGGVQLGWWPGFTCAPSIIRARFATASIAGSASSGSAERTCTTTLAGLSMTNSHSSS